MRKTSRTKVLDSLQHVPCTHTCFLVSCSFPSLSPHLSRHQEEHHGNSHFWKCFSGYIEHCRWSPTPIHLLTFFISDPWKGSYGGTCWPIWTWWGPNANTRVSRRHHFGSYLHRGLKMSTLFKEGRLQRWSLFFLLLNLVDPLICFNQGNAAGIKPCHFQGWFITDL